MLSVYIARNGDQTLIILTIRIDGHDENPQKNTSVTVLSQKTLTGKKTDIEREGEHKD